MHTWARVCPFVPVSACELGTKLGSMGKYDGFVDEDYTVPTVLAM